MRSSLMLAVVIAGCGFEVAPSNSTPAVDAADPGPGADAPGQSGCTDVDQDQVCDNVDDWLCGTKPAAPGEDVAVIGRTVWLAPKPSNVDSVSFNGVGPVLQTTAGAAIDVQLGWGIQTGCPGSQGGGGPGGGGQSCRVQIEYGLAGAGRSGCLVDTTVQDDQVKLGTQQVTITAPTAHGLYELRAKLGFTSNSCGTQTTWFGGAAPDGTQTFGYICIP